MKAIFIISGLILLGTVFSYNKSPVTSSSVEKVSLKIQALTLSEKKPTQTTQREMPSLEDFETIYKDFDDSKVQAMAKAMEQDPKIDESIKLANKNLLTVEKKGELTVLIRSKQAVNKLVLEKKLRELEESLL